MLDLGVGAAELHADRTDRPAVPRPGDEHLVWPAHHDPRTGKETITQVPDLLGRVLHVAVDDDKERGSDLERGLDDADGQAVQSIGLCKEGQGYPKLSSTCPGRKFTLPRWSTRSGS